MHFEPFVIESGGQFAARREGTTSVLKTLQSSHPIYGPIRIKYRILLLEVKTPRDPRSNNRPGQ